MREAAEAFRCNLNDRCFSSLRTVGNEASDPHIPGSPRWKCPENVLDWKFHISPIRPISPISPMSSPMRSSRRLTWLLAAGFCAFFVHCVAIANGLRRGIGRANWPAASFLRPTPPAAHLVALDERQRDEGRHHRRSRIDAARRHRRRSDFQPVGGHSRRTGALLEPAVARHVPSCRYRGRAARPRTVFPQLRRLVEQRRSLDQARPGDADGRRQ